MDDIQDILYKLEDVASHGATDLCKHYLHFLTSEEARIRNKLFNWKDKEEVAYENVSKRLSFNVLHLPCFFPHKWLSNWVQTCLKLSFYEYTKRNRLFKNLSYNILLVFFN